MQEQPHEIEVLGQDGGRFDCAPGERVLLAMEAQGRHLIPVGCRRGGCGICKVRVRGGEYDTLVMSRAQVSEEEQADGFALSCRLIPKSDLTLSVVNTVWIERRKEQLQKRQSGG